MNKRKKIIIVITILITILIVFVIFNVLIKSEYNEVEKYLINIGYVKDYGSLYVKNDEKQDYDKCINSNIHNECSGKKLYFDITTYNFYSNKYLQTNKVKYLFTPVYNYKTDKYNYTYRINYENGTLIFKGTYDMSTKEYSCDLDYSYGIYLPSYKKMCKSFEPDLNDFYYEIKLLIKDKSILTNS